MIEFQQIKRSWPFIVTIILMIIGLSFIISQSFYLISSIIYFLICLIIVLIFLLKIEKITFRGRFNNSSIFYLLGFIFSSFILIFIIKKVISELIKLTFGIKEKELTVITNIGMSIISLFIIYLTFKLIQLLYKRLQDLNLPGYYILGIVPVVNFLIGIKIYRSGNRLLGILVFINPLLGIIYILFASGTNGYNYFGIQPAKISLYKKEKRRILKAKSINSKEKVELINALVQKFENIEKEDKEQFIIKETNRLLKSEKLNILVKNEIEQTRKDYFENLVNEKILKNKVKINWK